MDNARQIEATLLQSAATTLHNLNQADQAPATAESEAEFLMEWHRIGALVELAHISASGLSGGTIAELLRIDNEAAVVFRQRLERQAPGPAPEAPHIARH